MLRDSSQINRLRNSKKEGAPQDLAFSGSGFPHFLAPMSLKKAPLVLGSERSGLNLGALCKKHGPYRVIIRNRNHKGYISNTFKTTSEIRVLRQLL